MDIKQEFILDKKLVNKEFKRRNVNSLISDYYYMMYEDKQDQLFFNRSMSIRDCAQFWSVDTYKISRVKHVKNINLCKDKFCANCQNLLSKQRYIKYRDLILLLHGRYFLYHVVFTVPNCDLSTFSSTYSKMVSAFRRLILFFSGSKGCRLFNFSKFLGCIRSVEITFAGDKKLHPHFHCIFCFEESIDLSGCHYNSYSIDHTGKRADRSFTDFEIFLQKVWFLLYHRIKVNKKNFSNVLEGYSVTVDSMKDCKKGFKEVFKYSIGGLFKKNYEPCKQFTYDFFLVLYKSLYRRRMIQGYGIFNYLDFDSSDFTNVDNLQDFYDLLFELNLIEEPISSTVLLTKIRSDINNPENVYRFITKKRILNNLED